MFVKSVISVVLLAILYGNSVECQISSDIRLRFYFGWVAVKRVWTWVKVILWFFYSSKQFVNYDVNNLHTVMSHSSYVATRQTVFYHYGFTQTDTTDTVLDMIRSYNSHGNSNFFLIYYLSAATNIVTNAREIGDELAGAYIRLLDNGQLASRLHLIGFSLGAQIQAIASRTVQSRTNRRHVVGRLTGLDPGQIQTVLIPLIGRLSASDAAFVDSIHTEGVGFGDHQSIGHVNYMVNGGVAQPFCTSVIGTIAQTCSHNFAVTSWAESVRAAAPIFPALRCASWNNFLANNCIAGQPIGNMGKHTSILLRGAYFLRTNNNAPFSRPQAGP